MDDVSDGDTAFKNETFKTIFTRGRHYYMIPIIGDIQPYKCLCGKAINWGEHPHLPIHYSDTVQKARKSEKVLISDSLLKINNVLILIS